MSTPNTSTSLFCDETIENVHFNTITKININRSGFINKIIYMAHSPYDRTLFLDTDIYVCEDISDLFALLDEFDIGVAHAPFRTVYRIPGVPSCFPEFNTGVVLFKKSAKVTEFFMNWLTFYKRDLNRDVEWLHPLGEDLFPGDLTDQPAFREALYRSRLRIATLPSEYNCRFNFPGFVQEKVRILHGRHSHPHQIAKTVNSKKVPRSHVMNLGRIRMYTHRQHGLNAFGQVLSSIQLHGFTRTLLIAKQRLLGK
jgi:hypothetical protein